MSETSHPSATFHLTRARVGPDWRAKVTIKADWTAADEAFAESYADAVSASRYIHHCGGEVVRMHRHYECLGCRWSSKDAPSGIKPRRWQVRAEND